MTNPPAPGKYICTIHDMQNEGVYGIREDELLWDGKRWIGCSGADVVVEWRVL